MTFLNAGRVSRCRKPWCQAWVPNRWQAKTAHDTQHAQHTTTVQINTEKRTA